MQTDAMATERQDLAGLEGYYLIPLPAGSKRPVQKGWQHLRFTVRDLLDHRGNVGLLLGPIYPCGGGPLELDIDNAKAQWPILQHIWEVNLDADAAIKSGGHHRGRKVFIWLRAHAWAWDWGHTSVLPGCDVRGVGCQAVIPPSSVDVQYLWSNRPPPIDELRRQVAARSDDFEERLYRVLYGFAPEDVFERDEDRPLPETMSNDVGLVLETLSGAGVRFGYHASPQVADGCIVAQNGGLLGVRLHACPACGGRGDQGRGPFEPGKAWVTHSGRLKCWHSTCDAAHGNGGLPRETWLPLYFPKLDSALLPPVPTMAGRTAADEGLSLEEGREAIQSELWDALNDVAGEPSRTILLDGTVGVGKTEALLRDVVDAATQGRAYPVFVKRHSLIEEYIERAKTIATEAGHPDVKIVHVKGMERSCQQRGEALFRARAYSSRPLWTFCRGCPHQGSCEYQNTLRHVGEPGVMVFAPHELAGIVLSKYPRDQTPAVFDELPVPFKTVRWSESDLRAVADRSFYPICSGTETEGTVDCWYHVRQEVARLYLRFVEAGAATLPPRGWSQYKFGDDLRSVLTEEASGALDYDPEKGAHPSFAPGDWGSGDEPQEGRHVRADFDDLARAWVAWLAGGGDLDCGVPCVYLDSDGGRGLALVRRRKILPDGFGAVILAAGAAGLEDLFRAAWKGRNLEVRTVHVEEPEAVIRLGVKGGSFARRNLTDPDRRRAALRATVLRLLPELADWRAQHFPNDPSHVLTVGIACPGRVEVDIRDRNGAVGEALDILEEYGCRVVRIGHFGALEGSNAFEAVDLLLLLGDEIPNLSEWSAVAHGLQMEAEQDAPSVGNNEEAGTEPLTGDRLTAMMADYLAGQTEGRARSILRTADSPVLIVRVGRRLERCDRVFQGTGRAPDPLTIEAELIASAMLRGWGWTTVPAVAAILAESGVQGLGQRFGHNCDKISSKIHSVSICNSVRTQERHGIPNRQVNRAVRNAAVRLQARGVKVTERGEPSPGRQASWVVFETQTGTYTEWREAGGTLDGLVTSGLAVVHAPATLDTPSISARRPYLPPVIQDAPAWITQYFTEQVNQLAPNVDATTFQTQLQVLEELGRILEPGIGSGQPLKK